MGRTIRNADELIAAVEAQLTEEKLYVFLDEIQTVKEWNIACRSLRLKNLSLFITGSNSSCCHENLRMNCQDVTWRFGFVPSSIANSRSTLLS